MPRPVVEHIDGDIFNNRKDNIRFVTIAQNIQQGDRVFVNSRQMATILYSLRFYQHNIAQAGRIETVTRISDHFHDHSPLNASEIDALCAQINHG